MDVLQGRPRKVRGSGRVLEVLGRMAVLALSAAGLRVRGNAGDEAHSPSDLAEASTQSLTHSLTHSPPLRVTCASSQVMSSAMFNLVEALPV